MNLENQKDNKVVITDTSCFVLLDKINALSVLNQLYKIVLTTPEVAKEYGNTLPDWVIIQPADQSLKKEYSKYIDEGEASAIALATQVYCDYVILDDMEARKFAAKMGLPIKGTVGVLLSAKQQGIIKLFRLDLVQQTNFRLSPILAEQFLKDAGE